MEETDVPAGAGQDIQPGLHAGSCRPYEALLLVAVFFILVMFFK